MLFINQIINRKNNNAIIYLGIIISLNINLISCNYITPSALLDTKATISINEIADNQSKQSIYITGKVIKVAPLLGSNAYQVQDSTGSIWVVTTANLPSVGQTILIKCRIQSQSLSLKNQELDELYLVELEKIANP